MGSRCRKRFQRGKSGAADRMSLSQEDNVKGVLEESHEGDKGLVKHCTSHIRNCREISSCWSQRSTSSPYTFTLGTENFGGKVRVTFPICVCVCIHTYANTYVPTRIPFVVTHSHTHTFFSAASMQWCVSADGGWHHTSITWTVYS